APAPGLRWDMGLAVGDGVGAAYDSLLGKAIAHAPDRAAAAARLAAGLDAAPMLGVATNQRHQAAILRSEAFAAGMTTTALEAGAVPAAPPSPALVALAALAVTERSGGGWFTVTDHVAFDLTLVEGGRPHTLRIARDRAGWVEVTGDATARLRLIAREGAVLRYTDGRVARTATAVWEGETLHLASEDETASFTEPRPEAAEAEASGTLRAPVAGRLVALDVAVGAEVAAGDRLALIEAMKMETPLTAPRAGRVTRIAAAPGDQVARGVVLIEIGEADG
ncbi:MAG: biotin/lipoyl-containing protein, partial [Pseudomonadota bacterium]